VTENYSSRKNNMDEDNIKLDFSEIDKLLEKLASKQGDLFYDDNLMTSTASASTISTVAGNTWPYPNSSSGSYTWTTNSTGGYNLGNISPSLNFNDTWQHGDAKLKVQGDAEFEGDVKIKGKSIAETLDKIEARLAILHPNEKLEAKWEELKKLGDAYRALEKDIIEKEQIWETLKK
jgi:hypothetical protein